MIRSVALNVISVLFFFLWLFCGFQVQPKDDNRVCKTVFTSGWSQVFNKQDKLNISSFSCKKRVVLKQNLIKGVNTLTQEMLDIYGENTKFIIKHDFVLGENITLPANCILKFKSGSISNGSIDFNHCKVVSRKKALYNVRFSNLNNIDVNIFNIPEDATDLLQDIVNTSFNVDLKNKTFKIHRVIEIDGRGGEFSIANGTIEALSGYEVYDGNQLSSKGAFFHLHDINKGSFRNITLEGGRLAQKGLFLIRCKDFVIDDCIITNVDGTDKTMSWGVRCEECSDIRLVDSYINNIIAMPVGKNGGIKGSAAGVVFEHTVNSYISNSTIENVQSIRDGDAIHIISIPGRNGKPEPTKADLYEDVNVVVSNNVVKANENSKRCIKIQANGVRIVDNFLQKTFMNKTNVVSIYGSNVVLANNHIDSQECYTIGVGSAYLNAIHDVVIRNNIINHNSMVDYGACIYMVNSTLNNVVIDANRVNIKNPLNMFCDLRSGTNTFKVSYNKVNGGSHFFQIKNENDNAVVSNVLISGNQYEGDCDLLCVSKNNNTNTKYEKILITDNTFTGGENSYKMFDVGNNKEVMRSITLDNNVSNKTIGL